MRRRPVGRYRQRHAHPAVGLQRHRRPGVAGPEQRHAAQPAVGQVPRRQRRELRRRHPAADLGLLWRQQPGVAVALGDWGRAHPRPGPSIGGQRGHAPPAPKASRIIEEKYHMGVSRRTVLTSAVAGSALAALNAIEPTRAGAATAPAASPAGDVVGKISVGYQGWFACIGDGAPINGWWSWSANWAQPPSPSNTIIKAWPDMREYTRGYQTAYQNLNGGGPARDAITAKVRGAAEAYSRKFYIMYGISGWTNMQPEIKTAWTTKMSAHTASSAYAYQNGKPVVCIFGFGYTDHAPSACLDVVNWFKSQGCYVIGGVPREWRAFPRPGFLDVYHAFNMLSPWMVGAISDVNGSDFMYQYYNVPDVADCAAHGIDYQPCVLPGDVSLRERAHGDFMWRQFYNMVRVGAQGIYISMFD